MPVPVTDLHDDETALLSSLEGVAAFRIVLPLIRALAMFIAGRGRPPALQESLPDLTVDAALERARYRQLAAIKDVK